MAHPATLNIVMTVENPPLFAAEIADAVAAKLSRAAIWDEVQKTLVEWVALYATHTTAQPELKLPEEVTEFLEAEHDTDEKLKEAADVLIVLASQLTFEGYTIEDLANAVQEKLLVNLARTWQLNDTGTISHVKDVSENDESGVVSDIDILLDEL